MYDAVDILGAGRSDLVYTGLGALCWLPDIGRWAQVVATLLRQGGRLFIREAHPMLLTLADPRPDALVVVEFPYFETAGLRFSEPFSYVAHDGPLASPDIVNFNDDLAQIITALMEAGMAITAFEEHEASHGIPWEGQWRTPDRANTACEWSRSASPPRTHLQATKTAVAA